MNEYIKHLNTRKMITFVISIHLNFIQISVHLRLINMYIFLYFYSQVILPVSYSQKQLELESEKCRRKLC